MSKIVNAETVSVGGSTSGRTPDGDNPDCLIGNGVLAPAPEAVPSVTSLYYEVVR